MTPNHFTARIENVQSLAQKRFEALQKRLKHQRGPKTKHYKELQEIVCDADLMKKISCIKFVELEHKVKFWL